MIVSSDEKFMAMHDDLTVNHPVVSHEEWLDARRALLEQEKAFTRQCDEMSRLQRSLPWERVTKEYTCPATRRVRSIAPDIRPLAFVRQQAGAPADAEWTNVGRED
jgi:hypothetical protein